MDVLAGPTFTIDSSLPPPPPYDGNRPQTNAGDRAVQSYGFFAGDSSESSSSIGTPDDSEDENDVVSPKRDQEEEEEVQSKFKGLASLDSLEDSLSIKRGLSSHFVGKSKSFTDLSQVSTVKELQKQENPFNKRRRVLIASKWSRRSFYRFSNPKSMPLLSLNEDQDEDEDFEEEKTKTVSSSSSSSPSEENKPQDQVLMRGQNRVPKSYATHMRLRLRSFKSRSFSLADLQEHDEEEEDEDNDD